MSLTTASLTSLTEEEHGQVNPDSRRYIFAIELKAGSRTEYLWDPKEVSYVKKLAEAEEVDISETFRQTLTIRRALIGASAKENETNLVTVEVEDPDAETVTFPLVYLTQGKDVQALVDFTFPELPNVKVKFTLAAGTGPVHLVGYHFVEKLPCDDPDFVSEAEEDPEAEDIDTEEEATMKAPVMRVSKRRIQSDQNGGLLTKKMKVGSENGNGDAAAAADEDMDKEATAAASAETVEK